MQYVPHIPEEVSLLDGVDTGVHRNGRRFSKTSSYPPCVSVPLAMLMQTVLESYQGPVKVTADGGKELRSKGPHLQVYILKRVWEKVM